MKRHLVFRQVAVDELAVGIDWYAVRSAAARHKFVAAVRAALRGIAADPLLHAPVFEQIRAAPIAGFPYRIHYFVEPAAIIVLAVFHSSRDPGVWQQRQ